MALSHPKINAIRKSIVCFTPRFAPANDCVLFVLVKLAFCSIAFLDRLGGRFSTLFLFWGGDLVNSIGFSNSNDFGTGNGLASVEVMVLVMVIIG